VAIENFAILVTQLDVADGGQLTTANATAKPINADIGLNGSFTIDTTGVVNVAGKVRWLNAKNLSNSGTLNDLGETENDPLVAPLNTNQAQLDAYLAMTGTPLANTLTNETVDLNPGVTVCSSSLTCLNVVFNLTGGPTDAYVIVVLGDWTMDGVTLSGTVSPNIVWAVQGSIFPDGTNALTGVFYFSTDFTLQGGTLTIDTGSIRGSVPGALTLQVNTTLSITTPIYVPPAVVQVGGGAGGRFRCCPTGDRRFQNSRLEVLAEEIRKRSEAWPYLHLFPDRDGRPQEPIGRIAAPAVGVLTPILTYQVPYGFRFYLLGIVQTFDGGAFAPGAALWTVDQDAQLTNVQGQGVQGLIGLPVPLGSFTVGDWWHLPCPYVFSPLTVLRSTVKTVTIVPGAPNFFTSCFVGYLEPVMK